MVNIPKLEYKKLEKMMCYGEVVEYLYEHPKYALLTKEELDTINPDGDLITFHHGVTTPDGSYTYPVYRRYKGVTDLTEVHEKVKLYVYVTYSFNYRVDLHNVEKVIHLAPTNIQEFFKKYITKGK